MVLEVHVKGASQLGISRLHPADAVEIRLQAHFRPTAERVAPAGKQVPSGILLDVGVGVAEERRRQDSSDGVRGAPQAAIDVPLHR